MRVEELNKEKLETIRGEWGRHPGGDFYVADIDRIIEEKMFGPITDRTRYQSTYFSVTDEGNVLSLMQLIVSGDGKEKTIKVMDLIPAPHMHTLPKESRRDVVVTALLGAVNQGAELEETGQHRIRVVKMYGRTSEIFTAFKVMVDELSEAAEEVNLSIKFEGGWFSLYPSQQ